MILDLFSRRVVGWATSQHIDRHLALEALKVAVRTRRPGPGLVHHSDRGSTYAAGEYRKALEASDIACSMSRKADCWDNACAESFFATLKRKMNGADNIESRAIGTLQVRDFIEYYNNRRRHSSIGYKTPIEFEILNQTKKFPLNPTVRRIGSTPLYLARLLLAGRQIGPVLSTASASEQPRRHP